MPAAMFPRSIAHVCYCVALLSLLVLCPALSAQEFELKADGQSRWYKGNMHTHTLWSDGDDYPEMVARWYKDHGYQFLVFTDHNTLHNKERWIKPAKSKGGLKALDALKTAWPGDWVQTRGEGEELEVRLKTFDEVYPKVGVPQEYILIQGEEITDSFAKLPVHMCATNTKELLPPTGGDSITDVIQRNMEAAISRRERTGVKTLVHLNHPNFGYAVTAEQLMKVGAENFFEVYNGHPSVHNFGDETHASTERMWDIINTFRLSKLNYPVMYGLGTDDGHNYFEKTPGKAAQPGRGWVVVLAETLEPDALVESLEAGRFYASSGVKLDRIVCRNGKLDVHVTPEEGVTYRIDFIGTLEGFDENSAPASDDPLKAGTLTRRYSAEIGKVLKTVEAASATYEMTGSELYVRAVVTSSKLHPNPAEPGEFERAWVQPVIPKR